MKKKVCLLVLALVTIFISSIVTFAGDKQPNYQPTSTPKTEEAWWDWFNSLPSEIQEHISFRPSTGTKGQDPLPQETGLSNDSMISGKSEFPIKEQKTRPMPRHQPYLANGHKLKP